MGWVHNGNVVVGVVLWVLGVVNGQGPGGKPQSHPFDFGDFLAIVIIMVLTFGGVCACLGKYARLRAGQI